MNNMKEINNKLTQKFDEYPTFGVLQGVKVFVTGTNIAGPFAGSLMAEMGAKVLQRHLLLHARQEVLLHGLRIIVMSILSQSTWLKNQDRKSS